MKTLLFLIPITLGLLWKSCQEELPLKDACSGCESSSVMTIEADILYNMSSLEFFLHSKENKHFYQKDFFIDSELHTHKGAEAELALYYGALWTDVSVMYVFENRTLLSPYLNTLEELHKELEIPYQINYEHIKNVKEGNLDSLFAQATTHFNHFSCCMAYQKRINSNVLILLGAWLEYMNYLCFLYEKYPSEELKGVIGYDKLILEQFILIGNASQVKLPYSYKENLKSLSEVYSKLQISVSVYPQKNLYPDAEMEIELSPETITIKISDSDFLAIRQEIKRLRKELLVK